MRELFRDRVQAGQLLADALMMPENFYAVGQWYEDFSQTTDAEVAALLAKAGHAPMRKKQEASKTGSW